MARYAYVSLSVACVLILCSPVGRADGSDEVAIPPTDAAPAVDGKLNDACWQAAGLVDGFTQPNSTIDPRKQIQARLCLDDTALYVAVTCAEPHRARIRAAATPGSNEVWKDDCIEVFIKASDGRVHQFIVNAAGVTQYLCLSLDTRAASPAPGWSAASSLGDAEWVAEIAIPWATLAMELPAPARMLPIKIGREDYAGDTVALATWPPGGSYGGVMDFGHAYVERTNALGNPGMSELQDGKPTGWGFGDTDRARFSSVDDGGAEVIRFVTPAAYAVAQQGVSLAAESVYRLEALVRGTGAVYLRARVSMREGEPSTPYTVTSRPSEEYQLLQMRFPTGETGRASILIGTHEGLPAGEVFIRDLRVVEDVNLEAEGPAISLAPGKPLRVEKVPVADCRALRGFVTAPVDGRLDSYNWNMDVWEYGMRGAGAGVGYAYRNNDGLHVTLADADGVDAVQLRGGAQVKLYADADAYDDPGTAPLLWEFKGQAQTGRAVFPERVRSNRFSFFEMRDGRIADVSFLRVSEPSTSQVGPALRVAGASEAADLAPFIQRRFVPDDRAVHSLHEGPAQPLTMASGRVVHLVTVPLAAEMSIDGLRVSIQSGTIPTGCPLTVSVQDPLNPRQELMAVDFAAGGPGELVAELDFPDQIVPAGARLWLSLSTGVPATLDAVSMQPLEVSREQALPEALAFRTLIMRGLFCQLSEARQWTTLGKGKDVEAFYRDNHWGPGVKDLHETLAQCKALGPDDPLVRCYDDWVWRTHRGLSDFQPTVDDVPGAPEWAILARQAWVASRSVVEWWLDNRLVPTGEFGGEVGDDTDMYQNFADFPMFESGGLGARVIEAGAALAELAEVQNLEAGLNRRTMDPLHAYEEGVNHEALMLWWRYGDPIYFERCLQAAKSMPALTVVTERGHRHFKNQDCGAQDLRIDRELGVDGHAHPLMWHPCLEVAWYNGSPRVVEYISEWADGWLEHMEPGKYATSVDVKTEQVTENSERPLYGGYGGQACAHVFLYFITGDVRFIEPYMHGFREDKAVWPSPRNVPELWHRGALEGLQKRDGILSSNPVTAGVALGDRAALCEALKADIAELQRFMPMYTTSEPFTDRVFLSTITNAAVCYTGGYATRNKYNHTHAVSWEGLGTHYAALVLRARPDSFKALVYNFRDEPVSGRVRLWTLDHGRYEMTIGPDADGDDEMDAAIRTQQLQIARATPVNISLPPEAVTVIEFRQIESLDDIRLRPDLAIAAREIRVENQTVTGIVHNIGGGDAPGFTIALMDAQGTVRAEQRIGPLAAPTGLEPKRLEFLLNAPRADVAGWQVVIDPAGEVPELFEENNIAGL